MSLEELLQEHIKALNENTKAIKAYTQALRNEAEAIEVEHTKNSACDFCGITYKTMQMYITHGMVAISRRNGGKREYFKEKDLVALCNAQKLFSGEYGKLRNNPQSKYYGS